MSVSDKNYMQRAIMLARKGRFTTHPNPNVGCVIVRDNQIVGEGFHHHAGAAHAEVNALSMAGASACGATVYVTLEPCSHYGRTPPCVDALLLAGVTRVVVAMLDPNPLVAGQGVARLRASGVRVDIGVLQAQAEQLNRGFLKRMRTGRPFVQLKLAASLDGRTAMASGESKWITSAAARQDVQQLRAQSGAILSTSETILADDPELTVRWHELPVAVQHEHPELQQRTLPRLIIDSRYRVTPQHQVMQHSTTPTVLIRAAAQQVASKQLLSAHLSEWKIPATVSQQVNLSALLSYVARQEINHLWVEAGAQLAGALLEQAYVDELIIYIAPKLLGADARPLCYLPHITLLHDAPQFEIDEITKVGSDIRLNLIPKIN